MRWIVEVDVGSRSRSAVHFSSWLADAMGARWRDVFVPVRVLEPEHLRMALRYHHLGEVVEAERSRAAEQISEVVGGGQGSPEIVLGLTPGAALEAARARHGAIGVIVSRAASSEGRRVFRLGPVAHRLLRRVASPLVVVPSDLRASGVGAGPVVALSGAGAVSIVVRRLAGSIAERAHRDLAFLQVDGRRRAAALALAEERGAALVAIGAQGAGGITGALRPRPWCWVAAHARQPVLIVPLEDAAPDRHVVSSRPKRSCTSPRWADSQKRYT